MSLQYQIKRNALTYPHSYTAIVVVKKVLELEDLARAINNRQPTIPEATASTILEAFAQEILEQLVEGNWINIKGFCSFKTSLPVRLENSTDPLPDDIIDCPFNPSVTIKSALKHECRYERLEYTVERPEILDITHVNTGMRYHFVDGESLNLYGNNLEFDQADDKQGVFLTYPGGYVDRQENYSVLGNANLNFTVDLAGPVQAIDYAEYGLRAKSTMGTVADLKMTAENIRIRKKISISRGADDSLFFLSSDDIASIPESSINAVYYNGAQVDIQIVAKTTTRGGLSISASELGSILGPKTYVDENTVECTVKGLPDDLIVRILDYNVLLQSVLRYSGYLSEIATLYDFFTPEDIPTILWLDASDPTTVHESGGFVSQWDDKSGHGNDAVQGIGSQQPEYINEIMVFDGAGDRLISPIPTITSTRIVGSTIGTVAYGFSDTTNELSIGTNNIANNSSFSNNWIVDVVSEFPLSEEEITNCYNYMQSKGSGPSGVNAYQNITDFSFYWNQCEWMTSFPVVDTSSGVNFHSAWRYCPGLTSFPFVDTSLSVTYQMAWNFCLNLALFPPGFFDAWTGVPANDCFVNTWRWCYALSAVSVENILNSIDYSGQSAPSVGPDITIDFDASSGSPSIATAVASLKSRGWTITLNGTPQ